MTTQYDRADEHRNEGFSGKYFHVMLNIADDELGPFEYRLLGHYIRVCGATPGGVCYQTVRTISKITRMSITKVIEARNELQKGKWIRVEKAQNKSVRVTLVDRMADNIKRYGDPNIEQPLQESAHDPNMDHGDPNMDRGDPNMESKNNPVKNNTTRTTSCADHHEGTAESEKTNLSCAASPNGDQHRADDEPAHVFSVGEEITWTRKVRGTYGQREYLHGEVVKVTAKQVTVQVADTNPC